MICNFCGKEFNDRFWNGNLVDYCSRRCYQHLYWKRNRKRKLLYFKNRYIPHPRKSKYNNEEERHKLLLEYSRQYYLANKDYYKNKNREWYDLHKNDTDRIVKHREAMRKYYHKKRKENING